MTVDIGRFGPYIKYGAKYVSLKGPTIRTRSTLDARIELIEARRRRSRATASSRTSAAVGIQVLNGRYGPYITDGKRNARIPKDRDPKSLTLAEVHADAGRHRQADAQGLREAQEGGEEEPRR